MTKQEINRSKSYFSRLQAFDALGLPFYVIDLKYDENGKATDFVYKAVNAVVERLFGKSKEQTIGKSRNQLFGSHQEDSDTILTYYETVDKTGNPVHFDTYDSNLGRYYHVYAWKSGDFLAVLARDITESKKDEKILREAQAKLQEYSSGLEKLVEQRTQQVTVERERFYSMLENMPVMVGLFTADYKVLFSNRLFREKFGEAKGRCCYEYIGCVTVPCSQCQSFEPLKTGKPHHWTATFVDGTVVDAHDFPFTDVDGTRLILEADVDITERIKLQKELQTKERLAAIGETAGMVGHDIRTPLQAIVSELYLAKQAMAQSKDKHAAKEVSESIDFIEQQTEYISRIISDLQDYARPLKPEYATVNLAALVDSVISTLSIPDKIKTKIILSGIAEVKTEPTFIKRILTNLSNNAIQAMPDGGALKVEADVTDKVIHLAVSDSGKGMPKEIRDNIFKPLVTTKPKGQGFGLPAVKRLVEALNGKISFESDEEKGTKFTIEMPIK